MILVLCLINLSFWP